jgi:hypothetical protein
MTMVIASYLIGDVVRYAHPINVLLKGQTHVKCQVRKIAKKIKPSHWIRGKTQRTAGS